MTQKEIIEGNKLIHFFQNPNAISLADHQYCNELKYFSSWDMLMPVVEKIELLGNYTRIDTPINKKRLHATYCNIDGKKEFFTSSLSKIEAVWKVVVKFIEWYNLNKTEK